MSNTLDELKEKLTKKQAAFADEYIIDMNGTQAAIRAGYSKNSAREQASKLLTKPNIKAYIDARLAEKDKSRIASQDEVLEYLTSVMRREKEENIVVTVQEEKSHYEPDNNGTMRKVTVKTEKPVSVAIPAKLSDSNKAGELLGKRYKLFTDKQEIVGAVPVVLSGEEDIPE